MADLVVTRDPGQTLCTNPLGACLGVALYDPVTKIGGLMHSMLPDSSIDPVRAANRPAMFLDTGLVALLERAEKLHARRKDFLIYVAGGGRIMDESAHFNIGKRNLDVLTLLLEREGLNICAMDVGGLVNRAMVLNMANGEVRLKISGQPKEKILCKP